MSDDPTTAHYETLLAPIYRWLLGDLPAALERSRAELESFGIGQANAGARGLDLGAGLGLQTIPLADAGYAMTAIDSSRELLSELTKERPNVTVVIGDLRGLSTLAPGSYDVVVCMGDTLTHLPTDEAVERLLGEACRKLAPGGTLALTFRDYASRVLESTERFISVRADANRILTCCLDYAPDRVQVTDLVHERTENGWTLRASAYPKLRLSAAWVRAKVEASGCTIAHAETTGGRVSIVARRSAGSCHVPK